MGVYCNPNLACFLFGISRSFLFRIKKMSSDSICLSANPFLYHDQRNFDTKRMFLSVFDGVYFVKKEEMRITVKEWEVLIVLLDCF